MNWNINTLVPVISFFLYAVLFVLVTTATPQTVVRRSFRWYLVTMLSWSFSGFMVLADISWTLFWFRVMSISAIATMASILFFTQALLEKKGKWTKFVLPYLLITSIIVGISDLVVKSVSVENNIVVDYQFGFLAILGIPGYLFVPYAFVELIREIRKTNDEIHKTRLQYLITGIGIMYLATFLNATPLGKYPVDIAANSVTALLIAYAILRYHLLDIRVVIRQGMVYSIPTIIIGAAYFLIITFSLTVFELYSGVEIFLLSLIVAVVTALLAEPLRVRAQLIIDRLFFREKFDSQVMLQNLSSRASSVLDLYKITNMILTEVTSTLHIPRAAFFLRDEDTGIFQVTNQIGFELPGNLSFRQGHPVALWFSTNNQPLTKHDLEVHPQFQSLWKSERQDLEEMEAELLIPIKVQSQLVGIFTLGLKRSEQVYSTEEKLTLSTVANQTAVAIENARLYTAEQNHRREIDTLYDLARQLVATDDLTTVINSVSRYATESVHVTYSRILIREENGDYYCRAIYHEQNLTGQLGLGKIEPIVAEHYFRDIMRNGQPAVLTISDPDLHDEEKQALFLNGARTLCLSPLIGVNEYIGLLVLGETGSNHKNPFDTSNIRLVKAISDHATSAIQRAMLHEQLEENFLQTVVSLANAIDARDAYTGDHSQRMGDLATRVSQAMKLSEKAVESVYWAAVLHDIGKIGVPDEILNKPGPLTAKEWTSMKEHPLIGAEIVAPVKHLAPVAPIILSHHERYDGSGYPHGLKRNEIPLGSRIVAVVDAYVAIRDKRVYSESHTHDEAIEEIKRCSGTQFDPEVVDVFCRTINGYRNSRT